MTLFKRRFSSMLVTITETMGSNIVSVKDLAAKIHDSIFEKNIQAALDASEELVRTLIRPTQADDVSVEIKDITVTVHVLADGTIEVGARPTRRSDKMTKGVDTSVTSAGAFLRIRP